LLPPHSHYLPEEQTPKWHQLTQVTCPNPNPLQFEQSMPLGGPQCLVHLGSPHSYCSPEKQTQKWHQLTQVACPIRNPFQIEGSMPPRGP
jgi:hypothetical protein